MSAMPHTVSHFLNADYQLGAGALPALVSSGAEAVTASQLLSSVRNHPRFDSGCPAFDGLLGGGLARGQVVEVGSPPACGKTKLGVGLAVRARRAVLQNPALEEVEALYIDAEGSAPPSLFRAAAKALCGGRLDLSEAICEGIHHVRVTCTAELALTLLNLGAWLHQHARVRLIVVDTLSAHLRPVSLEKHERAHVVALARRAFAEAASVHHCAILAASQMSMKIFSSATGAPADFGAGDLAFLATPSYGTADHSAGWYTRDTWRLSLYYDGAGRRRAVVVASPRGAPGAAAGFALDAVGFCDEGTISAHDEGSDSDRTLRASSGSGGLNSLDIWDR